MEEASDDDEHFGGGFREHPDDPMLAAEGSARRLEHEKAGMRDGYEAGKEETVQEGFNQGFGLASSAGFSWGRAMAAAAVLGVQAGVEAIQVKASVCDALWEAHGEAKDRFPERQREGRPCLDLEVGLEALQDVVSKRMNG